MFLTLKHWKLAPSQRRTELKHFEGVIDHSRYTYDSVRSRLAVDAANALERGDAKAAEALYRTTASKYPHDPAAYVDLAVCLGYQKRFEDSREQYQKALDLDPRSADAYRGLGSNAYEQGDDPGAIKLLNKSLELKDDFLTHWILALAYDRERDAALAIRHYEKSIRSRQLGPDDVAYANERLQALKK